MISEGSVVPCIPFHQRVSSNHRGTPAKLFDKELQEILPVRKNVF
jgi:hypothetical protein